MAGRYGKRRDGASESELGQWGNMSTKLCCCTYFIVLLFGSINVVQESVMSIDAVGDIDDQQLAASALKYRAYVRQGERASQ